MTYEEILRRMQEKYERESGTKADDAADIGIRLKVLAGEIHRLAQEMGWLRRQAFPQTALGEELDRHAAQRGLTRHTAKKAAGRLLFSRAAALGYDVSIPVGTICSTSGEAPEEYETTEHVTLKAGMLTVSTAAQAVRGGVQGNAAVGAVDTLVTPPVGIERVSNPEPFSGGGQAEGDEFLRARLMQAYSVLSNGTNGEFYRRKALEVEGVHSAAVIPRENGIGTVTVYVWGKGEAPPESVLEAVRSKLAVEREIGVDVTVKAAKEKLIGVYAHVRPKKGIPFSEISAVIEREAERYFAEKKIGDQVYKVEIGALLIHSGVAETYNLAINVQDHPGTVGVIPVLGGVNITELK